MVIQVDIYLVIFLKIFFISAKQRSRGSCSVGGQDGPTPLAEDSKLALQPCLLHQASSLGSTVDLEAFSGVLLLLTPSAYRKNHLQLPGQPWLIVCNTAGCFRGVRLPTREDGWRHKAKWTRPASVNELILLGDRGVLLGSTQDLLSC